MAVFSILTRAGDRAEPSTAQSSTSDALELAVPRPGGPSLLDPEAELKIPERPFDLGGHETPEPPRLALQLPDLATAEVLPSGPRFRIASLCYWTGIVLGALLALALIWTPQKAPVRSNEEAPAWSPKSTGQSDNAIAARAGQFPTQPQEASDASISSNPCNPPQPTPPPFQQPPQPTPPPYQPPPQPASEQPAGTIGGPLINNGAAHQIPAGQAPPQAANGFINSAQAPRDVRTASGPGARWDGSSSHVRPSEAAPLGITTPVPQ